MLGVALGLIALLWLLFSYTRLGIWIRATMENPQMARSLGIDTLRIYSLTFGIGAFLAGIAGGLYALTATIEPTFGRSYTPVAFITVVVGGGADVIAGLLSSVLTLAAVKSIFTNQFNILIGHVSMLLAAFLIIRFMPAGISEYLNKLRISRLQR
jgi:branched-chain amino acid transport system permease protein